MNAVVSGGSRGLGLAIVRHLLGRGDRVATFARTRTSELDGLAREHGDAFVFAEIDATDTPSVDGFVRAFSERHGGLDLLVNNAAIGQDSLLAHTPVADLQGIVRTNLEAPILLTRLAVREMLARPHDRPGRIVNIGSICGRQGYAGLTAYAATKGALESLTRSLARELGGRVLVNTIEPGFFESEMSAVLDAGQLETITRRTPSGRLSRPEDVLAVLDLLLSDANVNGEVIAVDGGATA